MGIYSTETSFEGNSISRDLYDYLLDTLPEGKTILELGSGWGTSQLLQHWNVWSVENNKKWFQMYNPQSVFIPITDGWYDYDQIKYFMHNMMGEYDLLLVDGPYDNRGPLVDNYHLFDHDPRIPIVFDDIKREEGTEIMKAISKRLNRPYEIYQKDKFGVIK
jgi:hypothetical protein